MVLLVLTLVLLATGFAAFAFDRTLARRFRAHVPKWWRQKMRKTTDLAKGLHWILISGVVYGVAQAALYILGENTNARALSNYSLALFACLVAGSAFLHSLKFLIGRRRPRDDFEHGFYGMKPFAFDSAYDSFPSGHAMTIFCLAVILSTIIPVLMPLWLALAFALAATRALLVAHFLSDVLIGAAIGVGASDIVLHLMFPALTPSWF